MAQTEKQAGIQDRISEIRKMRLGDIADNSRNWRLHPERQRKALSEAYKKVGWAGMPLVYFSEREGKLTFIDGHLRKEETPDLTVRVAVTDLNDAEADILLSTYDPLGRLAEVNVDALAELEKSVGEVKLEDFWPVGELETLLKGLNGNDEVEETEPQIDKAEELRKQYGVELGQIWQLGQHKIACVDSTDEAIVKMLVRDKEVGMVWADPPYGVNEQTNRNERKRGNITQGIDWPRVIGDDKPFSPEFLLAFQAKVKILWGANYYADKLPCISSWIVWDKRDGVASDDNADCELAWTNQKGPARIFRHLWKGAIKASEHGQRRVHPTQKPIALALWCFEKYGNLNDLIFDPFLGSGISVLAAEQMGNGQRVVGCELAPEYIAVSIHRWESHTGQKAELIEG